MCTLICKIPSLEELEQNWDREIREAGADRENWLAWKENSLRNFLAGRTLPYFGILDGRVVTQAVAHIRPEGVQNSRGLVDRETAYLSAFRTVPDCRGEGLFSELFRFMMEDLRKRDFRKVTLGVEPEEKANLAIYSHYGFTEFLKSCEEIYPDGTVIRVDYYGKTLAQEPEA